jgi:hypothetical protein
MAYYVIQPRLDELRIGRGEPSDKCLNKLTVENDLDQWQIFVEYLKKTMQNIEVDIHMSPSA